jgi:hypothetical protein
MKHLRMLTLVAVSLLAFLPGGTRAQTGIYWPAAVLDKEQLVVGTSIIFGDVPSFGWIAQARYGIADRVDASPKIGFLRESEATFFSIGGDFRYGIMMDSLGDDVDFSIVVPLNVATGNDQTFANFGVGGQVGKTFPIEGSDVLMSPYGGLELGLAHSPDNNDFGGVLLIGNQFQFHDNLAGHFELDVGFGDDTNVQVGVGIQYLY